MDTPAQPSTLTTFLPLIGVALGSIITFLVAVVNIQANNEKEDRLYRRTKLESLYIISYKLRAAFTRRAFDIIRMHERKDFEGMRSYDFVDDLTIKAADMRSEAFMITDIYFKNLHETVSNARKEEPILIRELYRVWRYVSSRPDGAIDQAKLDKDIEEIRSMLDKYIESNMLLSEGIAEYAKNTWGRRTTLRRRR